VGEGGGSHVFVWVFVKGHALKHSRKWEGHDFFSQKIPKFQNKMPTNTFELRLPLNNEHSFLARFLVDRTINYGTF